MRERIEHLNVILVIAVILCMSLFTSSIAAHHSRAGIYASDGKRITLEGKVTEWKFRNPHTLLLFDVTGSDGKVVNWAVEASSPQSMAGEGMDKSTFKGGEPVRILLVPARA